MKEKLLICRITIFYLILFLSFLINTGFSQDDRKLFDSLFNCHINDVLGTWEDGKGTVLKIGLINDDRKAHTGIEIYYEYFDYSTKKKVIEKYVEQPEKYYTSYNIEICLLYVKFKVKENKKRLKDSKTGKEYDKVSSYCYEYEKIIDRPPCLIVSHTQLERTEYLTFDFRNGIVYPFCSESYPIPLKRTSKGEIINKETEKQYTIKSTPAPKEIKPDGKSTSEIDAVLYEYISGNQNSSKPLSNKKVTFRIPEQSGITPGTLSAYEGFTDANGKVKVVYTAPDAALIQDKNIITSSVVVRCDEYNVEDIAYLRFIFEKGEITVEPNINGFVSNTGIVPPDKRFPADIQARIHKPNANITFTISGDKPYGLLKTSDGQTGKSVTVLSDGNGYANVQYFYSSDTPPDKPVTETIDIKFDGIGKTLNAYIKIGLNLTIEKVDNGKEGKGIINAYEEVPLKIRVKDAFYPELDLPWILSHWGLGGNSGNERLNIRLEIEPKGNVPDYLLDKLKLQKFPDKPFNETVQLVPFKDENNKTCYLLKISESSLNHKGFPFVVPSTTGQTSYELKISLVDNVGKIVSDNPSSSFISLQTGQPADAFSIYLLDNPFGPNTDEAVIGRILLNFIPGWGTFFNLVDGFEAINKGDYLFFITMAVSKFKDKIVDIAKNIPGVTGELAEAYALMTKGEEYGSLVFGPGVLTSITDAVVGKIASFFTFGTGKLILLHGEGSQSLINPKTGLPVAVEENSLSYDKEAGTISIKHGTTSIYFIPQDFEYKYENIIKSIEKPVTKGGKVTEKEKVKDKPKEKTKEKEKEKKSNLFSGSWKTADFGTVSFIISGSDVIATCTKNLSGMKGTLSSDGTKITGSWAKFPTYSSPNDAGKFEVIVSSDGKSFTGKWGNGTDSKAKLDKNLNGKKK